MPYIVKITHTNSKRLDILVEFPIYCLQRDHYSLSTLFSKRGLLFALHKTQGYQATI